MRATAGSWKHLLLLICLTLVVVTLAGNPPPPPESQHGGEGGSGDQSKPVEPLPESHQWNSWVPKEDGDGGSRQDGGGDYYYHQGGEDRFHKDREFAQLYYDSDRIRFKSVSKTNTTGDAMIFSIRRSDEDDPMRMRTQYRTRSGDTKSALNYRVAFRALLEYTEATPSVFDGYDESKGDKLVKRTVLDGSKWSAISDPVITSNKEGDLYKFKSTWNKIVTLTIWLSNAPYLAGGIGYSAGQVKVDIKIEGYSYSKNDSYLALECHVQTPQPKEQQEEYSTGEVDHRRVIIDDIALSFGWNRTVVVDREIKSKVVASQFKPTNVAANDDMQESDTVETAEMTVFAFDAAAPSIIDWDPYVGVQTLTVMPMTGNGGSETENKDESKAAEPFSEDHGDRFHGERKFVNFEYDKEKIKFESHSKTSASKDLLKFELKKDDKDDPMRIRVHYLTKSTDSKSALSYRVAFRSLVEFTETASAFNGYDSSDVVVKKTRLNNASQWSEIPTPVIIPIAGGNLYQFSLSWNSIVKLVVSLADAPYTVGGILYGAGQVKVDIIVEGYEYKKNTSYLALECHVQTPQPQHQEDGQKQQQKKNEGDDEVDHRRVIINDVALAFGWNRTVVADGAKVDVITSKFVAVDAVAHDSLGDSNEKAEMTMFSFNAVAPKLLEWDPYVGVEAASTTGSAPAALVYSVFLLMLAALLHF